MSDMKSSNGDSFDKSVFENSNYRAATLPLHIPGITNMDFISGKSQQATVSADDSMLGSDYSMTSGTSSNASSASHTRTLQPAPFNVPFPEAKRVAETSDICNHHQRAGLIHTPPGASPESIRKAYDALSEHMKQRWTPLMATSNKLQEVTESRCIDEHDMPGPPPVASMIGAPNLRHLRSEVSPTLNNFNFQGFPSTSEIGNPRKVYHAQTTPPSPIETSGLREMLMRHAAQPYGNQVKVQLRSLSFYDWTKKNGQFSNIMLGHFEGGYDDGTKLFMSEVSIPKPIQPAPTSPTQLPVCDRWLWFSIQVPIINITGLPDSCRNLLGNTQVPSSTIVFAAPYSSMRIQHETLGGAYYETQNIIVNPPSEERIPSRAAIAKARETREPDKNPRMSQFIAQQPQVNSPAMTVKVPRRDFDFSHHGIPAFEFGTSSVLARTDSMIQKIPALFGPSSGLRNQEYLVAHVKRKNFETPYSEEKKRNAMASIKDQDGKSISPSSLLSRGFSIDGRGEGEEIFDGEGINYTEEQRGFWSAVRNAAWEDVERWQLVRGAMSRGFCRIVARIEVEAVNEGPFKNEFNFEKHFEDAKAEIERQRLRQSMPGPPPLRSVATASENVGLGIRPS